MKTQRFPGLHRYLNIPLCELCVATNTCSNKHTPHCVWKSFLVSQKKNRVPPPQPPSRVVSCHSQSTSCNGVTGEIRSKLIRDRSAPAVNRPRAIAAAITLSEREKLLNSRNKVIKVLAVTSASHQSSTSSNSFVLWAKTNVINYFVPLG